MHPRVNIHTPGPGVGGHCIPVDPWFLINNREHKDSLIYTARKINLEKENSVVQKILKLVQKYKPQNVHIFGLTYKPNVDDFRESPSLRIASSLDAIDHFNVVCSDPYSDKIPNDFSLNVVQSPKILENDLVFILTKHSEYIDLLDDSESLAYQIFDFSSI